MAELVTPEGVVRRYLPDPDVAHLLPSGRVGLASPSFCGRVPATPQRWLDDTCSEHFPRLPVCLRCLQVATETVKTERRRTAAGRPERNRS